MRLKRRRSIRSDQVRHEYFRIKVDRTDIICVGCNENFTRTKCVAYPNRHHSIGNRSALGQDRGEEAKE